MRRLLLGGITLALVATPSAASAHVHVAAATTSLKISSTSIAVPESRTARIKVRCGSSRSCRGTIAVRVGARTSKARSYAVKAKASKTYAITLTKGQLAAVPRGGRAAASVRVAEKAPKKVRTRSVPVTLRRAAAPGSAPAPAPAPSPVLSKAFTDRNWTPAAVDTCSRALHETHSVMGPENKLYPTWHPPVGTDPATGRSCTFGHEHGDDPATSDIFTWVTDFIDDGDAGTRRGVPFGHVSEALDTYSASTSSSVVRHEDNPGHKIIVANDVTLIGKEPRTALKDADGRATTCDYLIKFHQGSHSGDATKNNAHETLYAIRCTDGTELISSTMTRYGNPNEFDRSCDQQKVTTSGSDLPEGFGGRRLIPDMTCVNRDVLVPGNQQSRMWSLYEVWESANRIQAADGTQLASFDPWFGVRNPSRVHAPGVMGDIIALVETLFLVDDTDQGTAKGHPWDEHAGEHLAKADPDSPFDGAQRDYYLQGTTVQNASGPAVWWSDPYGDNAAPAASAGFVKQWISPTDNSDWPELERRTFDLQKDYGRNNGVHAPN